MQTFIWLRKNISGSYSVNILLQIWPYRREGCFKFIIVITKSNKLTNVLQLISNTRRMCRKP